MVNRKTLAEKLLLLRSRIEDWCEVNGYENMDNQAERRNRDGEVVWKRTNWEYIDDMYSVVVNGHETHWNVDTFKEFNKLWRRYKIDVPIENANLEPDWQQLQQMDWSD